MANRTFSGPMRSLDRLVVKLYGRFTGAGAAAITGVVGRGFTITRTGVGLFTITLDDNYPLTDEATPVNPLLHIDTTLQSAALVNGGVLQVITNNVAVTSGATAKTITCRWVVAGAAADVAAADIVFIEITLCNTGAPKKGA